MCMRPTSLCIKYNSFSPDEDIRLQRVELSAAPDTAKPSINTLSKEIMLTVIRSRLDSQNTQRRATKAKQTAVWTRAKKLLGSATPPVSFLSCCHGYHRPSLPVRTPTMKAGFVFSNSFLQHT
ncbi:hypothetical protein AVEN_136184-1 [Araneus ventricosus]|uniref:Uncharacterized protein n=1 Tax=Araneus ventricosus TaxID=182803 RepID=A0A4Y2RAR4_ARAVE|nr:hypothetical protein AVEN_136184-1 [Araneus ventricosus]